MDQALELLPSDYWRWYLMANAPESSDAAFTLEQFQQTINADLSNVFGNFINRITRFAASKFDSEVPDGGAAGAHEEKLFGEVAERLTGLTQFHEQMEYRKAAAELRAIWVAGNEYLQVSAPWTALKTDRDAAAVGVRTGLNACVLFAILAQPFIPDAAKVVLDALGVPEDKRAWPKADDRNVWDALARGHKFTPPDVLFKKIEDEQVADLTERFGGGGAA
jgi:methionyl-tRNA synthetase